MPPAAIPKAATAIGQSASGDLYAGLMTLYADGDVTHRQLSTKMGITGAKWAKNARLLGSGGRDWIKFSIAHPPLVLNAHG